MMKALPHMLSNKSTFTMIENIEVANFTVRHSLKTN